MSSDTRAVEKFREFLRIKSVSKLGPEGSYKESVEFIMNYFLEFGFQKSDFQLKSYIKNKPVLIVTLKGRDPSLPAILLNSHYDVVPADESMWNTDPFSAEMIHEKIYARGTQDMKCVCIQHIESVGRLKQKIDKDESARLLRTIHLSFLPDEEIGGVEGAGHFVKSEEYKKLNIGVAFDEGLANPEDEYTVFYGERAPWWLKITANGPTGHASRFIERTAVEKLTGVLSKAYQFRREQQLKLHPTTECEGGCAHSMAKKLGDVVTLNVTAVKAGVPGGELFDGFALNCIPTEAIAGIDVRISPSFAMEDMLAILDDWTKEEGLSYTFYVKTPEHSTTAIDESNKWWICFEKSLGKMNRKIVPEIFPAATDSRYFRQQGVPSFGFSPMRKTPVLLHDHNEFLSKQVFLEGISVFEDLLPDLANLED